MTGTGNLVSTSGLLEPWILEENHDYFTKCAPSLTTLLTAVLTPTDTPHLGSFSLQHSESRTENHDPYKCRLVEPSPDRHVCSATSVPKLRDHLQKRERKDRVSQSMGEFAMRWCLLAMPETKPIKSHQHNDKVNNTHASLDGEGLGGLSPTQGTTGS